MRTNYTAQILLLFRERRVSDWESLYYALEKAFSSQRDVLNHLRYRLDDNVEELLNAKLLVADNPENFKVGTIRIADNWWKIQKSLDISLTQMAPLDPKESMFVQPLFGRLDHIPSDKRSDVFVLMPFSPDLEEIFKTHIKSVAHALGLKANRADDFFNADMVMNDIWKRICGSRVIIADCTNRNPNVFYEIGIAHTVGKPVIIITQKSEDVPFDLRHYRYIHYEYTPPGMKKFEDALKKTISEELSK